MIYHFTGNSNFLIQNEVKKWKNHFLEKHGDFNLIDIKNISDYSNDSLAEYMTAQSFGNQKRLVIINIGNISKEFITEVKQDFILNQLSFIPENNIILFHSCSPDKRTKFYKGLQGVSETKDFQIKDTQDIKNLLTQKYGSQMSYAAQDLIISYKSGNINKIISEIDKLLITIDFIEDKHIKEYIEPELEESIFQLIDDILAVNIPNALKKIDIILNNTNIYAFYNNLLANLRTQVYISKLKNLGIPQSKIITELGLGNKGFLVSKSHKITYKQLEKCFLGLIDLDKKMKSGKMIGNEESDFRYEMEKIFISI